MPNSLTTSQFNAKMAAIYNQPMTRISVELFLSLALVIFLTVFAIQPTLTTIARLNAEIEQKKELESTLRSKIAALNTAMDQYNRNRENISLLNQALPPTATLMPTIKTIEKLAGDSNVIINNMSVRKVPDETNQEARSASIAAELQDLPVTVTVVGTYQDIRTFVEKLHESRRIIRVLSASFSLDETRGQRLLSASLVVDAPYYGNAE